MPFPPTPRVIYGRNPLDSVICQLRFPPILKIDAELPVQFQEAIRYEFPILNEAVELNLEVPSELKGQIPPDVVRQSIQSFGLKNYEFSTEDEGWKVNLTRNFMALTAKKYRRWEDFKEKLRIPLGSLLEIYRPDHFSRIGLRYVDIIKRSGLGIDGVAWADLVQPYVAGILASPDIAHEVQTFRNVYEVLLADQESSVKMTIGLVEAFDTHEICFMIDSDFSNSHKTSVESAIERLDYFNSRASRLIRWAIKDRLHQAMEPQAI